MRFAFQRIASHATTYSFRARDDAALLAHLAKRLPLLDRDELLVPLNDEALATLLRFSARKP